MDVSEQASAAELPVHGTPPLIARSVVGTVTILDNSSLETFPCGPACPTVER